MTTPTDPTAVLKLARDALVEVRPYTMTGAFDILDRALAAIDALPAPSGEPDDDDMPTLLGIAETVKLAHDESLEGNHQAARVMLRDVVWSLEQMAGLTAQAAPAPQAEPVATVGDLIIQVRERVTARGILNNAPLYAAAPAVAAPVQPLPPIVAEVMAEVTRATGGA